MPTIICTSGCTIISGGDFITVGVGSVFGKYILPKYFTFTLQTAASTKPPDDSTRRNLFDFIDSISGNSLLSVYTTEALGLQYRYNNNVLQQYGPGTVAGTTTIEITISPTSVSMSTSADYGWVETETITTVIDTTGREYLLYLSNPGFTSAGGYAAAISITGKYFSIIISTHICSYYILLIHIMQCSSYPSSYHQANCSTQCSPYQSPFRSPHYPAHYCPYRLSEWMQCDQQLRLYCARHRLWTLHTPHFLPLTI